MDGLTCPQLFHLSTLPHLLLGTAASLLLVFRTNAAYDRFWEGRKLWGTFVDRTRDLASCTAVYLKPGPTQTRIMTLTAAHGFILQQHLHGKSLCSRKSGPVPMYLACNVGEVGVEGSLLFCFVFVALAFGPSLYLAYEGFD